MEMHKRVAARHMEAIGWKKLPKGWTQDSVKKFWAKLTGDAKHKVSACIRKMEGKLDNPGAFCASLCDQIEGSTDWRKGPRKKKAAQVWPAPKGVSEANWQKWQDQYKELLEKAFSRSGIRIKKFDPNSFYEYMTVDYKGNPIEIALGHISGHEAIKGVLSTLKKIKDVFALVEHFKKTRPDKDMFYSTISSMVKDIMKGSAFSRDFAFSIVVHALKQKGFKVHSSQKKTGSHPKMAAANTLTIVKEFLTETWPAVQKAIQDQDYKTAETLLKRIQNAYFYAAGMNEYVLQLVDSTASSEITPLLNAVRKSKDPATVNHVWERVNKAVTKEWKHILQAYTWQKGMRGEEIAKLSHQILNEAYAELGTRGGDIVSKIFFAKGPKAAQEKLDALSSKKKTARPVMFLTQKDKKNLPPLYSQENEKDPMVWVKLFHPYGSGTWLITEYDGRDTMFGYVMGLGHNELGYISLRELMSLKGPGGAQGIERDRHFKPMPLSQAKRRG
jgi:hypothetical protein